MLKAKKATRHAKGLRLVIDTLPSMIAYVDASKRYRIINRTYNEYFCVDENDIAGKHASEVLGECFYKVIEKYIDDAISGKGTAWETHHVDAQGNQCILSVKLSPYFESSGRNNGYLVIVEDITTQKKLQIELASLNHTLEEKVVERTQQLVQELARRKTLEKSLREMADHDPLTGLLNRRSFVEKVNKEINRSHRYKSELSYMILDIDRFKSINDTYGHWSGDIVLKEFARNITGLIRESDFIGRMGGEEFAIALPDTSLNEANEMGERLRRETAEYAIRYKSVNINFTVSIGISKFMVEERSFEKVFCRADNALYQAKNSGRNKVCVSDLM